MNATMSESTRNPESLEERIRQRAYSLWLDGGCPHGQALDHWLAAKQELMTSLHEEAAENSPRFAYPDLTSPFSIRKTIAANLADPTHRFHAPSVAHDDRLAVVAGEARQRIRGRHFAGSLRAQPKQSK
jgi:hypothetical protein